MDSPATHSTALDASDDILEAACAPAYVRPRGGVGPEPSIDRISYTHDAVIDFIIANPGCPQGQIAAKFGYTQAWMSIIINSDAFQARLRARRAEIVDPALVATVEDRFRNVAIRSLERLGELLEQPSPPPNVILKAVELGARGLDVGGFGRAQVTLPPAPPAEDHLAALAERLVKLQSNVRKADTYEDAQVVSDE